MPWAVSLADFWVVSLADFWVASLKAFWVVSLVVEALAVWWAALPEVSWVVAVPVDPLAETWPTKAVIPSQVSVGYANVKSTSSNLHFIPSTEGAKNVVRGDGNTFITGVDGDIAAGVGVNLLNSVVGTVTGGSGGAGGAGGAGGVGGVVGGLLGGGSGQNIANKGGNTITSKCTRQSSKLIRCNFPKSCSTAGPKNVITGSGNTVIKGVDLDLVAGIGANVLNTVVGTVTGGNIPRDDIVQVVDRDGNLLMNIWDKDGVTATNVANDFSNTVNRK